MDEEDEFGALYGDTNTETKPGTIGMDVCVGGM